MAKLKRCSKFGNGFDESSDVCRLCEDAVECMNETIKDDLDRREGKTPPIAKEDSVRTSPPIMVMFSNNHSQNGKFKMEIYIDLEWLKKRLGMDKK